MKNRTLIILLLIGAGLISCADDSTEPFSGTGRFKISGRAYNATTNVPYIGLPLYLREAKTFNRSEILGSTETDSNGYYEIRYNGAATSSELKLVVNNGQWETYEPPINTNHVYNIVKADSGTLQIYLENVNQFSSEDTLFIGMLHSISESSSQSVATVDTLTKPYNGLWKTFRHFDDRVQVFWAKNPNFSLEFAYNDQQQRVTLADPDTAIVKIEY